MRNKEIWEINSDMVYCAEQNAQALRDFNQAISTLYALEVSTYSGDVRNTSTHVDELVKTLKIDFADWASKLEMTRNLIFGEAINWEYVADLLAKLAKEV